MNKSQITQSLNQYFEEHPYASVDQLIDIVQDAKKRGLKLAIPKYQPIEVTLKNKDQYYDEKIKKVEVKAKHDESTFIDGSSGVEFKEEF